MPAGRLGREADDRPEKPRAPRGLLVRVALTEGLGVGEVELSWNSVIRSPDAGLGVGKRVEAVNGHRSNKASLTGPDDPYVAG